MRRHDTPTPLPPIERMIVLIRGEQVMLDADLALLYRAKTRALLQAVKRNQHRFPDDFVFQLTSDECMELAPRVRLGGHHGGRRYRPHAFTEQGAAMLASVLHNPVATQAAITILRAFARVRTADERASCEDRIDRRAFTAIRDAFLLQKGDETYTTRAPCTYFLQAGGNGPIKIGVHEELSSSPAFVVRHVARATEAAWNRTP
jgi:hypothetical protein